MVNDRFLSLLSALFMANADGLGFFPTSSMIAFAAALLNIGDAMALCSELLGPLPPPALLFFSGDAGGLILVSLDADAPNRRSCALRLLFGVSTPFS